jgi:hypothetical protein
VYRVPAEFMKIELHLVHNCLNPRALDERGAAHSYISVSPHALPAHLPRDGIKHDIEKASQNVSLRIAPFPLASGQSDSSNTHQRYSRRHGAGLQRRAVPAAKVRIRQPETDAVSTTVSGSSGQYRLPFLKPGDYEITAEAAGLSASPLRIHLACWPGAIRGSEARRAGREPDGQGGGRERASANGERQQSYRLQSALRREHTVNGGDITNVAFSTPGVRVNVGGGNNNFNVNGLPFSSVLFTYNGADIVEPYGLNNKSGSSNNTLGQNDVAEASVITDAYSAQYGRMAGAQVNFISKSGTNQFHGNLVENYNGDVLNANDYFSNESGTPRGRAVANQYAGSIGGPIKKDKLTFFYNYEGLRYSLPTNQIVSLPSAALQAYVLANVPSSSLPYYQDLFSPL